MDKIDLDWVAGKARALASWRRPVSHTERKQAAILAAIENSSLDALISIDQSGKVLSFNPAASRLFGFSEKEIVGENIKVLMPPHFRDHHDGYLDNYRQTGERKIIGIGRVVAGQRKDGSTFSMELSVGEAQAEGERIFVGTIRDLSDVERQHKRVQDLQSDLFHVSRLSEMGQIASSLAHEVNQPLAAIMNYAQAASESMKSGALPHAAIEGMLAKITTQATRAADIVKRLRAFIEKRTVEKRIENLNVLVEEALALALVGPASRGVRVRLDLSPDAPMVLADRVQIQQVLVNLVRNAIDAIETASKREIGIASHVTDNHVVEVSVEDTGAGIDETLRNKLFTAFVSSKEHGMGVGLSICKAILDDHRGRIWFEPSRSGGTVFSFALPLVEPAVGGTLDGQNA